MAGQTSSHRESNSVAFTPSEDVHLLSLLTSLSHGGGRTSVVGLHDAGPWSCDGRKSGGVRDGVFNCLGHNGRPR